MTKCVLTDLKSDEGDFTRGGRERGRSQYCSARMLPPAIDCNDFSRVSASFGSWASSADARFGERAAESLANKTFRRPCV